MGQVYVLHKNCDTLKTVLALFSSVKEIAVKLNLNFLRLIELKNDFHVLGFKS